MADRDLSDGTVIDCEDGERLWQKASGPAMTWADAGRYCASLSLTGLPWRLPVVEELALLHSTFSELITQIESPFIDDTAAAAYWSSTPEAGGGPGRYTWSYEPGHPRGWGIDDVDTKHFVRCTSGSPPAGVTLPSVPNAVPTVCGDGRAEGEEACDGADLKGKTCAAFAGGFAAANPILRCTDRCVLDASLCFPPAPPPSAASVCGDGRAEGAETCDGADLKGMTCTSLGMNPNGILKCNARCTLDTLMCFAPNGSGNGR